MVSMCFSPPLNEPARWCRRCVVPLPAQRQCPAPRLCAADAPGSGSGCHPGVTRGSTGGWGARESRAV